MKHTSGEAKSAANSFTAETIFLFRLFRFFESAKGVSLSGATLYVNKFILREGVS